jgi:hypothetical protein
MRKQIVRNTPKQISSSDQSWLDLDTLAQVEVTSEDAEHPIESALLPGTGSGWRAAEPGEQKLRILFDTPRKLTRIRLLFREDRYERTQEFVLSWSAGTGQPDREIVRQQYHFSPPGTTTELEEYTVDLDGVMVLEMRIRPDISGRDIRGSLSELRLA